MSVDRSKTQIFISYKTGLKDGLTMTANGIRDHLETHDYDVWMDKTDLVPGEAWDTQIYEAISKSDVVLLLLAETTATSDWVRREIDVARGAQVFVLPVLIRDGFDFQPMLNQFAIANIQIVKLIEGSKAEYNTLRDAIEQNKSKTRDRQEKWLEAVVNRKSNPVFKEPHTPANKQYAAYTLNNQSSDLHFYLAAGDIAEMSQIDVIVNPENNYMQMARIFESNTVSSRLRLHGSRRTAGGQIREDTVQQHLYDQIFRWDEYNIPVNMGFVVPTHSGHASSKLASGNKARYIFHCVTVSVDYGTRIDKSINPIPYNLIPEAVTNCLNKTVEVNRQRGIISPPETDWRVIEEKLQNSYKPVESIIFPLFATGRGGREREVQQVAGALVSALRDYFVSNAGNPDFTLKSIYICAYSKFDVQVVEGEMDRLLARV